jgi:hypothetical protein
MSHTRRGPLHPLLRESGFKLFLLSLVTGLFTAISIALLWSGDLSPTERREFWAITLFFGAGFIFFTLPALPGLAGKFKPTIEIRDERPAAPDGGGDALSSELVFRPSGAVSFLVWLVALGFLPISLLSIPRRSCAALPGWASGFGVPARWLCRSRFCGAFISFD